jgi:hypothetical protein
MAPVVAPPPAVVASAPSFSVIKYVCTGPGSDFHQAGVVPATKSLDRMEATAPLLVAAMARREGGMAARRDAVAASLWNHFSMSCIEL